MNSAGKEKLGPNTGRKREDAAILSRTKVFAGAENTELVQAVLKAGLRSLEAMHKGELRRFHDVAQSVNEAMVGKFGGAWHTIVGKSYGSFVTHEDQQMVYVGFGPVLILTFKHG